MTSEDDPTRAEVVEAIREAVAKLRWRVREDDEWVVVLLPPLARSKPERDRWPDEPKELFEPGERDRLGRFLINHRGRRMVYRDDNDFEGEEE
jgi:hypothetical protein